MTKYWIKFVQYLLDKTALGYVQVSTDHIVQLTVLKIWTSYGDYFPWRGIDEKYYHYLLGYKQDYQDSSKETIEIDTPVCKNWKEGDCINLYTVDRLEDAIKYTRHKYDVMNSLDENNMAKFHTRMLQCDNDICAL